MKDFEETKYTVENKVARFLRENPDYMLSMKVGIINVSKLAQLILKENEDLNPISVRAALNRFKGRLDEETGKTKADDLLKKSRISLQDRICVVTSKTPQNMKYISATHLHDSIVYIVDEIESKIPPTTVNIMVDRDVSLIHIFSSKEIEKTPGFVMRITHKLYARGINILQLISCSNETILILNKKDSTLAYEILTSE
ncbi:MAG: aspartate kinase [Thermoplasmatales archaeon]|nr:aspartate kinase [Thermoplasmatales archaeon]